MAKNYKLLETKLIHAGEPEPLIGGAVSIPIFQSSTFAYAGQTDYHELKYIRLNNTPNHTALHIKFAALENAEAAVVTSSGMAAITTALLALLSPGDHFLAQACLYGGTHEFISHDLAALNITYDTIDGNDPDSWEKKLKPNTRLIYFETMTNPLLEVADLKAASRFAKENNVLSLIDNTFATPVNFRPSEWGFDLSIHSCSKYLNGHSDIVAGAVIGKADLIKTITHKLNILGGTLDPHACFLLHRGIKTLAVRMRHVNESTLKIARFLENHPAVEKVNYPGIESHPHHKLACEFLSGFSGMLSFELKGGLEASERLIRNLTLPVSAPSLGGVESLITRPATTSHSDVSPRERAKLGISDALIRLSVGIEATQDLIDDFDRALSA